MRWWKVAAVAALLVGLLPAIPTSSAAATVWQPPARAEWQWEIGVPLNVANAKQMGTGRTAWNGDSPPGTDPTIYDIDGIENPASTVAALHQRGAHVICYVEVGSAGNYYTAAEEGETTSYYAQLQAAGDFVGGLAGYPEKLLNIKATSTVAIVESMIDRQCAAKGFDAVETDLDETFAGNEGPTTVTISQADEESYLTALAEHMHGEGLAWIAKNLDDTGIGSFVADMAPLAQGTISEQCRQYHTCGLLAPFAGKWVADAEYGLALARFCPADNAAANFNGVKFTQALSGSRQPCR